MPRAKTTAPHPTTTPSVPQPHPTPHRQTSPPTHARALSPFAFNLIFDPNFKDFSGFFTLFKAKIASFSHLNAEIERENRLNGE